MIGALGLLPRLARRLGRHGLTGARHVGCWIGRGLAGARSPRPPRRHGHGPYPTAAHHAAAATLYVPVLAGWLAGRAVGLLTAWAPGARRPGTVPGAAAPAAGVHLLDVLSADECAAVCARVHDLRDLWIRRQPGEFFTLGRASYMDCPDADAVHRYRLDARRLNEVLRANFQPLYAAVTAALERALVAPCRLGEEDALPGFHIWLAGGIPRHGFDVGSVHFDLQYQNVGLARRGWPTTADVLSFTLPLRLPRAGGGLNVWDIRESEPQTPDMWRFRAVTRIPYAVGRLMLHTGHEMHQIAPVDRVEAGDERICLQGHGIRVNGSWRLYW